MEFLRYPHLIAGYFNRRAFGPPWSFTSTSSWTWVGHPVSGRVLLTSCALFRLALATAPYFKVLNLASYTHSPDHSTIGTISHIDVLYVLVSTRFQVLFHSPPGVLFTFPSQYCYTIGHWVVFRLGGWSPHVPTGFHVSGGTLDTACSICLSFTGLSPSLVCFPTQFN